MTADQDSGSGPAIAEPVLVTEQRGTVQVLRLNRPAARNALNPELISALGLALTAAEDKADVRCVILTGTGDRAFCAGMDLRAFAESGTPSDEPTVRSCVVPALATGCDRATLRRCSRIRT